MQNAPLEHSAILSNFIKLPFVIKIFVLSIFEWPFYTGFTARSIDFFLANSVHVDPDEMSPYALFHLGLHCLPKYSLRVSSPYRINCWVRALSVHRHCVDVFVFVGPLELRA